MTKKIGEILEFFKSKTYKNLRSEGITVNEADLDDVEIYAKIYRQLSMNEKPVIFDNDSFGFNRFTKTKFSHSWGNITPNYARIITDGFDKTIENIYFAVSKEKEFEKKKYGLIMIDMLKSSLIISDNYKNKAKEINNEKLYNALSKIP